MHFSFSPLFTPSFIQYPCCSSCSFPSSPSPPSGLALFSYLSFTPSFLSSSCSCSCSFLLVAIILLPLIQVSFALLFFLLLYFSLILLHLVHNSSLFPFIRSLLSPIFFFFPFSIPFLLFPFHYTSRLSFNLPFLVSSFSFLLLLLHLLSYRPCPPPPTLSLTMHS